MPFRLRPSPSLLPASIRLSRVGLPRRLAAGGLVIGLLFGLTACNQGVDLRPTPKEEDKGSSIFGGERGINIGEMISGRRGGNGGGDVYAVNKYLWRASLQTLSFLPIRIADPASGFIQTDWYNEGPQRRFRVEVFILGTELKTEALEVAIHNEIAGQAGWQSGSASEESRRGVENAILLRARQLRVSELNAGKANSQR